MKRILLALMFCWSGLSRASITPANPYIVSGPNVMVAVNDPSWMLTAAAVDTYAETLTVTFRSGAATTAGGKTTAFAVDPNGGVVTVVYYYATGTASSSNGKTWVLTTTESTAVNAVVANSMTAIRDPAESDAMTNNIFGAGATNYPW